MVENDRAEKPIPKYVLTRRSETGDRFSEVGEKWYIYISFTSCVRISKNPNDIYIYHLHFASETEKIGVLEGVKVIITNCPWQKLASLAILVIFLIFLVGFSIQTVLEILVETALWAVKVIITNWALEKLASVSILAIWWFSWFFWFCRFFGGFSNSDWFGNFGQNVAVGRWSYHN